MTTVRLYFDADSMERAIIAGLRARGIDAISALETAMAEQSDEEQLEFARAEGRVLFSFNVSDFHRLHTQELSWLHSSGTPLANAYADCRSSWRSARQSRCAIAWNSLAHGDDPDL